MLHQQFAIQDGFSGNHSQNGPLQTPQTASNLYSIFFSFKVAALPKDGLVEIEVVAKIGVLTAGSIYDRQDEMKHQL